MTILCVGSINVDHVYRVPRIPEPGETIAAKAYARGAGGKGANQSIAAAKAGALVHHVGAVGPEGAFVVDEIARAGVLTDSIRVGDVPTGHAIITVDQGGENAITLFSGANNALTREQVAAALKGLGRGDSLMLQNEVDITAAAAELAHDEGLRVIYSAAPFNAEAVRAVLPFVSLLLLNEVEAAQMAAALSTPVEGFPVAEVIITRGAKSARWLFEGQDIVLPAFPVDRVVDTTGAGDCFAGYVAAGLDAGQDRETVLRQAMAAGALQVTRAGAAAAMPTMAEVEAFLAMKG